MAATTSCVLGSYFLGHVLRANVGSVGRRAEGHMWISSRKSLPFVEFCGSGAGGRSSRPTQAADIS